MDFQWQRVSPHLFTNRVTFCRLKCPLVLLSQLHQQQEQWETSLLTPGCLELSGRESDASHSTFTLLQSLTTCAALFTFLCLCVCVYCILKTECSLQKLRVRVLTPIVEGAGSSVGGCGGSRELEKEHTRRRLPSPFLLSANNETLCATDSNQDRGEKTCTVTHKC